MNAFYRFRFYELDQALAVGDEKDFAFFNDPHFESIPKKELRIFDQMILVFANTLGNKGFFRAQCKINAIYHPELGSVTKIDTEGLDYKIALADGTEIILNAEEEPGKVVTSEKQVSDWAFLVDITSLAT